MEGRKTIMETMEVFAGSFTVRPIMSAILSDTAINIARLPKYSAGFSGSLAWKASGAANLNKRGRQTNEHTHCYAENRHGLNQRISYL